MTETAAPFNTPSLVFTLHDGTRIVAQPETIISLRFRNNGGGPSIGLGDLAAVELHLDENEPGEGAPP